MTVSNNKKTEIWLFIEYKFQVIQYAAKKFEQNWQAPSLRQTTFSDILLESRADGR